MDVYNKEKTIFTLEGVLFILLGVCAIVLPGLFTLAFELLLGWLFIIGAVMQAVRAYQTRHRPGLWVTLLSACFYAVVGVLLVAYPLQGILTLTFLLAFFFFVEGIVQILFATTMRPLKQWGWLLLNGVLALVLALIIWSGWPGTSFWVLGLLAGVNFLFYGFSKLFIASNMTS